MGYERLWLIGVPAFALLTYIFSDAALSILTDQAGFEKAASGAFVTSDIASGVPGLEELAKSKAEEALLYKQYGLSFTPAAVVMMLLTGGSAAMTVVSGVKGSR